MALQTTFNYGLGMLPKGSMATCENNNSWTGYTTVDLPFGVAIVTVPGITGQQPRVSVPTAAITRIDGVVGRAYQEGDLLVTTPDGYKAGQLVRIYNEGVVVVYSETAVNPSLPIFTRIAANGTLTQLGDFRATADGTTTTDVSTNLRWRSTTTGPGFALLSMRLG